MKRDGDMTPVRAQVGARIRETRKRQGLSQHSLALMIGMDRSYISGVERGKRNISIDNLAKIAGGLGITLSKLMEGVEIPYMGSSYTYFAPNLNDPENKRP